MGRFRLFPFVMASFTAILLISNTVAVKVVDLGPFYFDGATILFPLVYIFADILTEVYGYARSRQVIWMGFGANILMAGTYYVIGALDSAPDWTNGDAYQMILGQVPRVVAASLIAYLCGEFVNSYILSKMKIMTKGKKLYSRTISSTLVGQAIDTSVFVFIAFWGVIPADAVWHMMWSNYIFKTTYEIAATPLTYLVVNKLKKYEHEDHFDYGESYNPFSLDTTKADQADLAAMQPPKLAPDA